MTCSVIELKATTASGTRRKGARNGSWVDVWTVRRHGLMRHKVRCILAHTATVESDFPLQCPGVGEVDGKVWRFGPAEGSDRSRRQLM